MRAIVFFSVLGSAVCVALVTADVTLVPSAATLNYGDALTLTATVTGDSPTGLVTFYDSITQIEQISLTAGSASMETTILTPGTHSISAIYGGDANNSAGTATSVAVLVNGFDTTTVLTETLTNDTLSLSATVNEGSSSNVVGGDVTFFDGSATLGVGQLVNGVAGINVQTETLSNGTHSLTASFVGNGVDDASTSSAVSVDIEAPPSDGGDTGGSSSGTSSSSGGTVTTTPPTATKKGGCRQTADGEWTWCGFAAIALRMRQRFR